MIIEENGIPQVSTQDEESSPHQSPQKNDCEYIRLPRKISSDNQLTEKLLIDTRVFTTKTKKTYSASPIGLLGFSCSCFIAGIVDIELITFTSASVSIFVIFAGLLRYVSGVADWRQGNTLSSTLSILYGCYNIDCVLWIYFDGHDIALPHSMKAFAYFNLVWCVLEIPTVIALIVGSKVLMIDHIFVFFLFFFGMLYGFTEVMVMNYITGIISIIIAIITFYAAFAMIFNSTYEKIIFPLFRKGENYVCCCKSKPKIEKENKKNENIKESNVKVIEMMVVPFWDRLMKLQ